MTNIVPISEARDRLTELLSDATDHDVILLKHGKPVGVLLSVDRYESILEKADDLDDITTARQPGDYVPFHRATTRDKDRLAA